MGPVVSRVRGSCKTWLVVGRDFWLLCPCNLSHARSTKPCHARQERVVEAEDLVLHNIVSALKGGGGGLRVPRGKPFIFGSRFGGFT